MDESSGDGDALTSEAATLGPRLVRLADGELGVAPLSTALARSRVRESMFGGEAGVLKIGRHVVLEPIGKGGMGVVYAAYDPELDRKVALKLLHGDGSHASDVGLQREARALAKLAHPNVIAVYDVGTTDVLDTGARSSTEHTHPTRVFVAMEFVDGDTLSVWLRTAARSRAEIVSMFVQAGRGLAAAHAAGIIHRDFKPDNVLVGHDGRARVMDFGLARPSTLAYERSVDDANEEPTAKEVQLTRSGALVGTPAYMAPEQFGGLRADGRTDQFAFCIALFEALCRIRPFPGDSLESLALAVTTGNMREFPRDADVPSWLRRIIVRGLAAAPEERFADMAEVLHALERGRARARWRRVGLGAATIGLLGVAIVSLRQVQRHERIAACEAAGAGIDDTWNETTRGGLHDAHVATGVSYAADTAARVEPWLDRYATAWRDARTGGCLSSDVTGDWSLETYDRSQWCLDERRMQFDALVGELLHVQPDAVRGSVGAAANLGSVAPCLDESVLARLPVPPVERRDEVRAALSELARASASHPDGDMATGLTAVREIVAHASELQWPPLLAEARWREGALLEDRGEYEPSEQAFVDSYFLASEVGAWDVAAEAATKLAFVLGARLGRHQEALAWGRHARLAETHAGDPEGLRESTRLQTLATVHQVMGDHANAMAMNEAALVLKERVFGADHPAVAPILGNLSGSKYAVGNYEEARALVRRMLQINENALGPDHPDVAQSLEALAILSGAVGEQAEARRLLERVLAITETSLGPNHHRTGLALVNLANTQRALGDTAGALASCDRALAIIETAMGAEHPDVAHVLVARASALTELGRYDEAIPQYRRALAIRERALPADHAEIAIALNDLAHALAARGDHDAAEPLLERALAILEKQFGPAHPNVAWTLAELATIQLERAAPAKALELAQRAIAIHEQVPGEAGEELDARFVLAQALAGTGDSEGARNQAERARAGSKAAGEGRDDELALVDAWLAALPR